MKKWLFGIALFISLALNVLNIIGEISYQRQMEFVKVMNKAMGGGVDASAVSWGKGLEMFNDSLQKKFPEQAGKKYYYINMWAMFCGPCIKEMPWLDSLAGTIKRKDVAYIFLSNTSDKSTNDLLSRKKFRIKNFVFLGNLGDFISSVYYEQKRKTMLYPTVVVVDSTGKLCKFSTGAYENFEDAKEFVKMIESLE